MGLVFDIGGRLCPADHVRMRGNTLEAGFDSTVIAALADAFKGAKTVSVAGLASLDVTYSVQDYSPEGPDGCKAIFSVNSSAGRKLH